MKHFMITLIFILAAFTTQAQNNDSQGRIDIQPPTVASFMKYTEHPVGLYHGNPEIAHTLYTLKDGSIELPLTLRYNASGIKVNEEASWVGLGWNLSLGGMVVHSAVGREDKKEYFGYSPEYYPTDGFSYYSVRPYQKEDETRYNSFFQYAREGHLQPDVFSFFYPGGSGKFFIDQRDDSIHLLDDSTPIQVVKNSAGWEITTPEGIRHSFGQGQKMENYGTSVKDAGYTYYLLSSTYPNGETVSYNYSFRKTYSFYRQHGETFVLQAAYPAVTTQQQRNTDVAGYTQVNEGTLESITTPNYTVTLHNSARTDCYNTMKLDSITVVPRTSGNAWGNPRRSFRFSYDYFLSPVTTQYWQSGNADAPFNLLRNRQRLKLLSVCEYDVAGHEHNKLLFDYYTDTTLPMKNSYAVDYWGYYNGQTANVGFIPTFKHLLWGQTNATWRNNTGSALRAYDFASCKACMLKRVTYPTGGYHEYTYEPHEFQCTNFIPTIDELKQIDADMAPVYKQVVSKNIPNETKTLQIEASRGTEMSIKLRVERGLNSWSDMAGCTYKLERMPYSGGVVTTVLEGTLDLSAATGSAFEKTLSYISDDRYFHLTISLPASLGNQEGASTNHGSFTASVYLLNRSMANRGYNMGGGVRVKRVAYYDSGSTSAVHDISYTYPTPTSNGVLFVPVTFHRSYDGLRYYQKWNQNGVNANYLGIDGREVEVSGSNLVSSPYSSIGTVGYSKVTETRGNGKTEYTFTNTPETYSVLSFQIPHTGNGKVSTIYRYNSAGTLVESETNSYVPQRTHFYRGVTVQDNLNRTPYFYTNTGSGFTVAGATVAEGFEDYAGRMVTMFYEVSSNRHQLVKKVAFRDGVTSTFTYEYDTRGQLKKKSVTDSEGRTVATVTSYPYDYAFGAYSTMTARHMLAYPVEVKRVVDGKLTESSLTQYAAFGTLLLPSGISHSRIATPITDKTTFSQSGADTSVYPVTDVTFLDYDTQGNPTRLKVKGEEFYYLWGYKGQYPVAEVHNVNYDSMIHALGYSPSGLSALAVPPATVDLLRTLQGALVTTYTYKPLFGMTSMTAPNKQKTTFEYDGLARLTKVIGHDGKTAETYDYNYR